MVIRIVTDSTASIPAETAQALGITIVPLIVVFGDDAYLDSIELDSASFYRKLSASKVFPRTSLPTPAAFQQAYMRLIEEGADAILSIHISSKLSGTYQSAWIARETLPDEAKKIPIELVDSQSASIGTLLKHRKTRQSLLALFPLLPVDSRLLHSRSRFASDLPRSGDRENRPGGASRTGRQQGMPEHTGGKTYALV